MCTYAACAAAHAGATQAVRMYGQDRAPMHAHPWQPRPLGLCARV